MKLRELTKQKKMVSREYLIYETRKYVFNFLQFETLKCFAKNIKINLNDADKDQSDLNLKQ